MPSVVLGRCRLPFPNDVLVLVVFVERRERELHFLAHFEAARINSVGELAEDDPANDEQAEDEPADDEQADAETSSTKKSLPDKQAEYEPDANEDEKTWGTDEQEHSSRPASPCRVPRLRKE